jgi:hypothetical protein
MFVRSLASLAVGAAVAAGLSVSAAALVTPVAAAAPVTGEPCMTASGPDGDSPSQSCADQRQECMSASAQEGIYGERYVPPDAVAMCMETYRSCVNANSDSGSDSVG